MKLLLIALVLFAGCRDADREASKRIFFYRSSCSLDGNGMTSECATTEGGSGAWNKLSHWYAMEPITGIVATTDRIEQVVDVVQQRYPTPTPTPEAE